MRLPRRLTLMLALTVFAVGHVIVAVTSSFAILLAARRLTAFATGAFGRSLRWSPRASSDPPPAPPSSSPRTEHRQF